MAAKDVVFSQPARRRIAHGLDVLANTVKVTLGPRGRTVLLENAASVAGLMLMTEALVAERRNDAADVDSTGS